MFPRRFFGAHYFGPRYFGQATGIPARAIAAMRVVVKAGSASVRLAAYGALTTLKSYRANVTISAAD